MPVVGGEGAAVFPLGITDSSTMDDLNPTAFAAGFAGAFIGSLVPPWDDSVGDGVIGSVVEAVVKRQGNVKWIQSRGECFGAVVIAGRLVRVVVAAVVFLPFGVP